MKVYSLKTCDTCRKALREMTDAGLDFEQRDIRADGLDAADIAAMAEAFGDKVINRASTTWRGLDDAQKDRPAVELIAENPTLLKRPVILKDGIWFQGWTPAVKTAVLG